MIEMKTMRCVDNTTAPFSHDTSCCKPSDHATYRRMTMNNLITIFFYLLSEFQTHAQILTVSKRSTGKGIIKDLYSYRPHILHKFMG